MELALQPSNVYQNYGYMWWLNTGRRQWPSAPERSFAALGAGANLVWVDPKHDLVVVLRWIDPDALDEALYRALAAIRTEPGQP